MEGKVIFGNLPNEDKRTLLEQLSMRTGIEGVVLEKRLVGDTGASRIV